MGQNSWLHDMNNRLSKSGLDFVRRAAKEIVCCLLPDELPYFDVIWRAIEPMLRDPAFRSASDVDFFGSLEDRLGGLAFAATWCRDADLLTPNVMRILDSTLEEAISGGICWEDQVADLVARHSLRWPAPDRFLGMVHMFVAYFCGGVVQPDEETKELLQRAGSLIRHSKCYVVFHNGRDHFYPNELPEDVLELRKAVLFWIDRAAKVFRSRDQKRKGLRPQTERVLRFICSERNAGKTISFSELYSYVWRKDAPSDERRMVGSIEREISALNKFAAEPFQRTIDYKAKLIRGTDSYQIKEDMPSECCIIRSFNLPD